jgi:hypothetical protein
MPNEHAPQQKSNTHNAAPAGESTEAVPDTAAAPSAAETAIRPAVPETPIAIPTGPGVSATNAALSVPMASEDEVPAWLARVDWLLIGLVVVLAFLVSSVPAFNPDIWMHLATGRMIAHLDYPVGSDPFALTTEEAGGRPAVTWVNHSWLYQLGLYLLYSAAGGIGVIVAKGLLIAALTVTMLQIRKRDTNLFVVAILLALSVLTLSTRLAPAQPILFSYLFLAITLCVLHRAGAFEVDLPAGLEDSKSGPGEGAPRGLGVLWILPALFVLWVNIDNWFVLGPITVALCWAGAALQRWRGMATRVPLGKLGAVLGLGLAACVVNPFHVRAFQLPPDLALFVVRGADLVGVPVPDALTAGGKTLAILYEFEPEAAKRLSPLSSGYLSPNVGYNIAGLCFFPLLGLGLLSFLLCGLSASLGNGPPPHAARFLIWLFFAAMAVMNQRLLGLFAVVAGPLSALNFGDLLTWYGRPREAGALAAPWSAPVRLARLLSVPLLVALLLFAWPGWLNGPVGEWSSRRHVAWEVPPDESSKLAAERLAELRKDGREIRVFNTGLDFPHYCAWFAPGVKCFFDARYNLFSGAARDYVTAKQALFDKSKPPSNWTGVFRTYDIDHVVLENFLTTAPLAFWADSERWAQKFADTRIGAFAWSRGTHRWPSDLLIEEWNALAFGPVPEASRAPAAGPPAPPEGRGLLERYLYPPVRLPHPAFDIDVKKSYAAFLSQTALRVGHAVIPGQATGLASLPTAPGASVGPQALVSTVVMTDLIRNANVVPLVALVDREPPAIPVLNMRLAWQTVAEAPENERGYTYLADAIEHIQAQEGYWVNPTGREPQTLRVMLRRMQVLSALRAAAELGFADVKDQYQVHHRLTELYLEQHFYDLALEQIGIAELALEQILLRQDDPKVRESLGNQKKRDEAMRKQLEAEVSQRKREFTLNAQLLKPLQRVRHALHGPYRTFTKENQPIEDRQGLGLAGTAWQLLQEIDTKSLSPEEHFEWLATTLDLLFKMGHARAAADIVEKSQEAMGPLALANQAISAGSLGNYEQVRKTLSKWEEVHARQSSGAFQRAYAIGIMAPPAALGESYWLLGQLASKDPNFTWFSAIHLWQDTTSAYFNIKTLRGIMALEQGDTADAHRTLREVVRESNAGKGFFFLDRPIAERYTTFLSRYQKR